MIFHVAFHHEESIEKLFWGNDNDEKQKEAAQVINLLITYYNLCNYV